MSDIFNPTGGLAGASMAAQQTIIELIRAGKICSSNPESAAQEINELYEKLVDGYIKTSQTNKANNHY